MEKIRENLAPRLVKNALLMTCLEMIVRYGIAIIVLPIALKKLDSTELAYYLFINTLIALAYLADSGFSQAILRASAYFKAGATEIPERVTELAYTDTKYNPNWKAVGRLIVTSNRIYLIIGLAATILLSTFGVVAALNIVSQQHNSVIAWLTYILLVVLSFLLLQVSRWSFLLQGLNEVARAKSIELVIGGFKLLGVAAAIIAGFGVLGVVIVMIFSTLINLFLTRRVVLLIVRENYVYKEEEVFDSDMLKRLWPSTWRMGIIGWGVYLIYYSSSLVVSQIPDPKIIASYLLTFQIVTLLYRFASTPALVYQPQLAAAMSNGDLNKINIVTFKVVRYSLFMYVIGGFFIYFFGNNLLYVIQSKTVMLGGNFLLIILLIYFLEIHQSIHAGVYITTNHVPFMIPILMSGIIIVIGNYFAVSYIGIYGVILPQLLVQIIFNNWYPVYLSLKIQELSFSDYFKRLFHWSFRHI